MIRVTGREFNGVQARLFSGANSPAFHATKCISIRLDKPMRKRGRALGS
jgi:hypothetical protein